VRTRTTQEDRDELRKYFVDLIAKDAAELPPRHEREKFMVQVLLDCQDALDRLETIQGRLRYALDGIDSAQGLVSGLLLDIHR